MTLSLGSKTVSASGDIKKRVIDEWLFCWSLKDCLIGVKLILPQESIWRYLESWNDPSVRVSMTIFRELKWPFHKSQYNDVSRVKITLKSVSGEALFNDASFRVKVTPGNFSVQVQFQRQQILTWKKQKVAELWRWLLLFAFWFASVSCRLC